MIEKIPGWPLAGQGFLVETALPFGLRPVDYRPDVKSGRALKESLSDLVEVCME